MPVLTVCLAVYRFVADIDDKERFERKLGKIARAKPSGQGERT